MTTATRPTSDDVLLRRWRHQGDRAAREQLVRRHLPLARRLASRYGNGRSGNDDLQQVAAIGLIKAIDRFDVDRGLALSTFAVPTILGEVKRYLRDTTWSVRVPRDLQDLALRVDREGQDLERMLGRPPTMGELSVRAGASVEQVVDALEARRAHRALSLDAPAGEGAADAPRPGFLEQVGADDPDLGTAEDRTLLETCLGRLEPREREILRLRFAEDLTQAEIGARLGISQMHVSRLLRRSLAQAAG